jgi:Lon-like ATP-dependent protease
LANGEPAQGPLDVLKKYATNGREAVNIVQIAAGIALTEQRQEIGAADIEWVVNSGQYSPRPEKKIPPHPQVGLVNGLAVYGPGMGALVEIEATATRTGKGKGKLVVTGVIDEEEIGNGSRVMKRQSMARGSVENVLTTLKYFLNLEPRDYDIHVNFPGGVPIDGPSAGVAVATAICSAIKNKAVDNKVAMTGEVSIRGLVKPVGGIVAKVEAARQAGVKRIFIPRDNFQETFQNLTDIEIISVEYLADVFKSTFVKDTPGQEVFYRAETLSAAPM